MSINKADFLAYSEPEVTPIYKYKMEIDTTPEGATRTWAPVCAGFENITEALNETIQQYFFLCGGGFAANYVTGMAPAFTLTGRRVVDDAAQNYIFGKKYDLMSSRNTHARLTRTDEAGTASVISMNVALANIQDISGATTDASACSVEIRMNGQPYIGDAWSA